MDQLIQLGGYIAVVIVAFVFVGVIFTTLYKKASKEVSFVRTGLGGQKVVLNGGALVFPVIHELIRINMNTLRLEVRRNNEQALITRDRMRVDVTAEFYVRVKPLLEAIADAAQTLGQRTMNPASLKELIEGKFVDALRAVAAEMAMEELHEQRVDFVQKVQSTVSEDLLKNGLELEAVSLTSLDQTGQEFFNPQNAFDAQGLTMLTEQIEARRKERNDIEQDTRIQVEQKNLEAEQASLNIQKEEEYAKLQQEREIEVRKASQVSEIAKEQALQKQQAREAEISAQQQIEQKDIVAKQGVEQQRIEMERDIQQREIQKVKDIETADIEKRKAIETADIDKRKYIELGEQDRAIAIAEKSKSQSEAEAQAAVARAEMVKAEEQVETVRKTEIAQRQKTIELVQAAETAEKDAIKVTEAARADKEASESKADALRLVADGEAYAEMKKAEAAEKRYEVDASGQRALYEAKNVLDSEVISMEIKKLLIENLPSIIAQSVKPMEQIDGIKIIQVDGLSPNGGDGVKSAAAVGADSGSLADQLVNSALRYRGQAPLVDALMSEVGLKGGDLNGLTNGLDASYGVDAIDHDQNGSGSAPAAHESVGD